MTYRCIALVCSALLLGAATLPAAAGADARLQPHDDIRETVRAFLLERAQRPGAEIEIEIGRLDPRLRLGRCARALEAYLPPSGRTLGRVTIGVRCDGDSPWSLYVPAQVQAFAPVVVAARQLERGSTLGRGDLRLERRDLGRLHRGYFLDPARVVGKSADQVVRRGRTLDPGMLSAATTIRRGEQVNIVASLGGIEARMRGKALSPGAVGELIRVENLSSGKELQARIVSAGTVAVDI